MKTSVIMNSPDRELFGVTIRQQTGTGFLNLSDLQEAYTHARVQHGWSEKNLTMLMGTDQNIERIYYLLEKQGVIKLPFLSFMEEVEKEGVAKTLKKYSAYKTTGARNTKTTWANPYIWVLIAMEMNPMLYANVVSWLTDKLIINRIEAGNFYKDLSRAVSKFPDVDYVALAKALNWIVFNRHETGIRNFATQSELKEMEQIESKIAFAIDMGYINSFGETLTELRKLWSKKNA
jgi:hypothetical protein